MSWTLPARPAACGTSGRAACWRMCTPSTTSLTPATTAACCPSGSSPAGRRRAISSVSTTAICTPPSPLTPPPTGWTTPSGLPPCWTPSTVRTRWPAALAGAWPTTTPTATSAPATASATTACWTCSATTSWPLRCTPPPGTRPLCWRWAPRWISATTPLAASAITTSLPTPTLSGSGGGTASWASTAPPASGGST